MSYVYISEAFLVHLDGFFCLLVRISGDYLGLFGIIPISWQLVGISRQLVGISRY